MNLRVLIVVLLFTLSIHCINSGDVIAQDTTAETETSVETTDTENIETDSSKSETNLKSLEQTKPEQAGQSEGDEAGLNEPATDNPATEASADAKTQDQEETGSDKISVSENQDELISVTFPTNDISDATADDSTDAISDATADANTDSYTDVVSDVTSDEPILIEESVKTSEAVPTIDDQIAPQIICSDLTRKQALKESIRIVNFIVTDDDKITEIFINGSPQKFMPAGLVLITKRLQFEQGKSIIRVEAVDQSGNRGKRSFLVGHGERTQPVDKIQDETSELSWVGHAVLQFETDTNPTNDPIDQHGALYSPGMIETAEHLGDLYGAISNDEQTDSRRTLNGRFSAAIGDYSAYIEAKFTNYQKPINSFLNSQLLVAGLGYSGHRSQGRKWLFDYVFIDINLGSYDYSVVQVATPAIEFRSRSNRGEYRSLVLALDLIYKDFAEKRRESGFQTTLKSKYQVLDETQQHLFKNSFEYGSSTEGIEDSEFMFLKADFDWMNKWTFGLQMDVGFGFQYKAFKNVPAYTVKSSIGTLGQKRVDIPVRISGGAGWNFSRAWKITFDNNYVVNFSNKTEYTRLITGVSAFGKF